MPRGSKDAARQHSWIQKLVANYKNNEYMLMTHYEELNTNVSDAQIIEAHKPGLIGNFDRVAAMVCDHGLVKANITPAPTDPAITGLPKD